MVPLSPEDSARVARLSLAVTRLARVLRQQEGRALTPAAAAALATIVRDGPITLGELAAAEGVSPSTVTRLVSGLEGKGLVERVIDPADRRVHRVRMTGRARRAIDVYRVKRNAWLTEQVEQFSAAERAEFAVASDVLERLAEVAGPDPLTRPEG